MNSPSNAPHVFCVQSVSVSPRLWFCRLRWVAGSWPLLWCLGKHHSNFQPLNFFREFNCPALSHAAVSISCMAGESQVPDPFLGVHVREGNLTLLGTTQSDRCGWYYCPCLPSCPALRSLPCLLGSNCPLLLSTSRLPSTLTT